MTFVPSPEQQAILAHGLEPLRVEAGAGTGKTTTLAYRVVALMDAHGIEPDQILGVTFTNKAAFELSERIREARSGLSDPARQADVFTYHGFAAQLLSAHGALIGIERDTKIVTPTFSRQILLDSVRTAPFVLHDITHRPTITSSLLKLTNDLSDNLRSANDLLDLQPVTENDFKRAELAGALEVYEAVKTELGALDYGDLIRLAVKLVAEHPRVAKRLRDQYRSVLLDEYQDTNPAQRMLFQSIFGSGTAVTAVGDPDQTIYEWRGATPANFASFPDHFRQSGGSPAQTLPLSVNRRSGQPILDLANRLRQEVQGMAPGLDLVAADPSALGHVHIAWYQTARHEAEEIAAEAHRLHSEGVDWSEMAVLFRKNKDISLVRDALDEHDVPLQVANLGGLLGIPEIVEIHAWLRILADPEDGPALVRILLGSRFRLGFSDLAPLARWAGERSRHEDQDVADHTLVEGLDHLHTIEMPDETRSRLIEFRRLHRDLLTEAQGSSLIELTRQVLARIGAWQEIDSMPYPAGLSARLNVHRFLDLAEDWSPLEGRPSLEAFLTYLELMAEDPVEELDTARVGDGEAVTLMTIHRAKGLEWDAVFVPALYQRNFPSVGRILDPSTRPYAIPASMRLDPEARHHLDPQRDGKSREGWLRMRHANQEWRLAYVATTRARTHLYLSGAHWYGTPEPNKRAVKPSRLIDIARELRGSIVDAWSDEPGDRPLTLRFPPAQAGPDPAFGTTWDDALRRTLADPQWPRQRARDLDVVDLYDSAVEELQQSLFALPDQVETKLDPAETRVSVTGLVTYADCPKRFYWSEVDRLPRRPSSAARRGVELHRRIELYSRGIVPFDDLTDETYDRAPDEVADDHERGWAAFAGSRFAEVTPRYIEVPFELLLTPPADGDQPGAASTAPSEHPAWIRGRVDAVYPDGDDGWEIVDFKSGRRSNRPSANVQLQAYALAARASSLGAPAPPDLAVTFVYLGDGLDVVRQEVDDQWLGDANARLGGLIENIRSQSFDPTPSAACTTCDFIRFCAEGKAFVEAGDEPSAI